jgi:hypothetical protein
LIALSIVYVAWRTCLRPTLTPWRLAVVFASGCSTASASPAAVVARLPRSEFLTALCHLQPRRRGRSAGGHRALAFRLHRLVGARRVSAGYRSRVCWCRCRWRSPAVGPLTGPCSARSPEGSRPSVGLAAHPSLHRLSVVSPGYNPKPKPDSRFAVTQGARASCRYPARFIFLAALVHFPLLR